jgi:hypothetical protein
MSTADRMRSQTRIPECREKVSAYVRTWRKFKRSAVEDLTILCAHLMAERDELEVELAKARRRLTEARKAGRL